MWRKTQTLVVVLAGVVTSAAAAQDSTIPARIAASKGKSVHVPVMRDGAATPLEDLAAAADLIVVGKLLNPHSYLDARQTDVYTDYELRVEHVIRDRLGGSQVKRPGPTPPIIVTIYGGDLIVDGTPVHFVDMSLIRWKQDASLLLFLVSHRQGKENGFEVCGGPAGIFEVDGARVKSALKHPEKDKEVGALALDEIAQKAVTVKRKP